MSKKSTSSLLPNPPYPPKVIFDPRFGDSVLEKKMYQNFRSLWDSKPQLIDVQASRGMSKRLKLKSH